LKTHLDSKAFHQFLLKNETLFWAYVRRVFADRPPVQLELSPPQKTGRLWLVSILSRVRWRSRKFYLWSRSAGSAIAEDFALDFIPEFVFIDDLESGNSLMVLERKPIVWQPSSLPPQLQELILADLFGMS
jgi:hypothetical protein